MQAMNGFARKSAFGQLGDGRAVDRVTLGHAGGMEAHILTYGATLQSLLVPDLQGRRTDVMLGHDAISPYETQRNFLGSSIGRFANRIGGGKFSLEGEMFHLSQNEGSNLLHGGADGFDQRLWEIVELEAEPNPRLHLRLISPDGDQGFPGRLQVDAEFILSEPTVLEIIYEARTNRPTMVSLCNHSYFNLSGVEQVEATILDHQLQLFAEHYLPVRADFIPEGDLRRTDATPFDFRAEKRIGRDLDAVDEQLDRVGNGYDHCYVLGDEISGKPRLAARLTDPTSGRKMELSTNQPGLQVYSGNSLDGDFMGKQGVAYQKYAGLCLEPQHFPDAPNQREFPSSRLDPGETYRHHSIYRFST